MTTQAEDTAGYGKRLAKALRRGPRPMSVRKLARETQQRYPHLGGTSYGGVRQYAEGNIQKPRVELLRAFADVLGVREEWLAFDDGAPTEEEERARRAREEGRPESPAPAFSLEDFFAVVVRESGVDPQVFADSMAEPLVIDTWARLVRLDLSSVDDDVSEEAGTSQSRAAATIIGRAIAAPFARLPIQAHELEKEELTDFVMAVCQGLNRLADAHHRIFAASLRAVGRAKGDRELLPEPASPEKEEA